MADYRTIRTTYWNDPYLEDLGPSTRAIYVYLFSCSHTNNIGYGEASPKRMHIETAIPIESVVFALKRLEHDKKIVLDGKRYWLRNFVKNQCTVSDKLLTNLNKLLGGITSIKIRSAIAEMYDAKWKVRPEYIQWRESLNDEGFMENGPDEEAVFIEELLSAISTVPGGLNILGRHLKGYGYPMDTPSKGINTHADGMQAEGYPSKPIQVVESQNQAGLSDFSDSAAPAAAIVPNADEKKSNDFNKSSDTPTIPLDTPSIPLEGVYIPPEELKGNGNRTGIEGNILSSSELPIEPDEIIDPDQGEGGEGAAEPEPSRPQKTFAEDSDAYRVSLFLFNCIAHRKPDFKKPNLQAWARHADLMLRVDKRELESVQKVIRWSQTDDFWQSNILSTAKLREKFDQLEDKMNSAGKTRPIQNSAERRLARHQQIYENLMKE